MDATALASIVVAAVALTGGGVGTLRWQNARAVNQAALKALVDANLITRFDALDSAVVDQNQVLARLDSAMAELRRTTQPNGLDSQDLGDIAARTENKVDEALTVVKEQGSKLDQHIGASNEANRQIRLELSRKQDRQ